MSPIRGPRPANRVAAALMLLAAGMAAGVATDTAPILFAGLGLAFTAAALVVAVRGRAQHRADRPASR